MTRTTKLVIALLAAVSLIGVVTAWANTIYLPVIEKHPTYTPTVTATATATATKTPSISPTPTRTPTPKPGVYIIDIVSNPTTEEYIEIKNTSSNGVDMKEWAIKADWSGERYVFPDFTLGGGKTVKVWSKVGTDTSTNLYWNLSTEVWKDTHDTAYLRDDNNDLVNTYQY